MVRTVFRGPNRTAICNRNSVLTAFAIAGAVAIPFAVVETTYRNVFLKVFTFGTDATAGIGVVTQRLGINRAQGALGQPIPYAMFLSIAALAAFTLWFTRVDRRTNRWLYVAIALVAVQATTLARTGWLMLGIVAGAVAILQSRNVFTYANRRLIVATVMALAIVIAVPQTNELIFGGSGSRESTALETSANYRSKLLHEALQPGFIKPFGSRAQQPTPGNVKSVDNEYIHAAWMWGYLPILGFAIIFLALIRGAWRGRADMLSL